jgi:enoyl-CoA hydratase/carnithine racemase
MANGMTAMEKATKPTIAAIEGCCYGGSVALSLACDVRISSTTASLQ